MNHYFFHFRNRHTKVEETFTLDESEMKRLYTLRTINWPSKYPMSFKVFVEVCRGKIYWLHDEDEFYKQVKQLAILESVVKKVDELINEKT